MLSISHVATGAFIASKVSNPLIAIPLILASHFLEDWIPHWDVGTGLTNGTRKKESAFGMEIVELVLSFVIVYFFFQFHQTTTFPLWTYVGGFVGLIPDFLEFPRNFFHWEPFWLEPINKFHGIFHHSTPNMVVGLTPQFILLLVIFLLK
ncbi:MAG: hypothetical protein ABI425_04660 [Patescibacteria group bacterium]